jgi:hypothetical protein
MFFLSPILSLFSVDFYKKKTRQSLKNGIAYLFYLTALLTVFLAFRLTPLIHSELKLFSGWLYDNLPALTMSSEGLSAEGEQPKELTYDKWNMKMTVDTTKDIQAVSEMKDSNVWIGKTKIYIKGNENQVRIFDLLSNPEIKKMQPTPVSKERITDILERLRKLTLPVVVTAGFFIILIWKFFAALFYSLIARLINNFRKVKLGYSAILNVSFFLLTPVAVLQVVGLGLVPKLKLLASTPVVLIVVVLYTILAILLTQEETHS